MIEQFRRHLAGDRSDAATTGQLVVPVPSVEGRVRDERVEAGAEGDGGDHHHDGQGRADDGRAHGHRVAAGSGVEREPDALDRRYRQPVSAGGTESRSMDVWDPDHTRRRAMGGLAVGDRHGHGAQDHDEDQQSEARVPSSRRRSPGRDRRGAPRRSAPGARARRRRPRRAGSRR